MTTWRSPESDKSDSDSPPSMLNSVRFSIQIQFQMGLKPFSRQASAFVYIDHSSNSVIKALTCNCKFVGIVNQAIRWLRGPGPQNQLSRLSYLLVCVSNSNGPHLQPKLFIIWVNTAQCVQHWSHHVAARLSCYTYCFTLANVEICKLILVLQHFTQFCFEHKFDKNHCLEKKRGNLVL